MSNKYGILAIAKDSAEIISDDLGYELVDVEYVKEGDYFFLRVFIHKDGGITLDDCQIFSQKISKELDEKDLSDQKYYLEVSSPGLDRPLKTEKDYNRNLGKEVELKLYKAFENRKKIEGILKSFNDETFEIESEDEKILNIPRETVSLMKLVIKF